MEITAVTSKWYCYYLKVEEPKQHNSHYFFFSIPVSARIINAYWRDVIKVVFTDCDSKWTGFWTEQAKHCKSGAEEFAMEQIGECFQVADCYHLGVGAASSVAGSFCKREGLFHDRDWLPLKCVKHAETSCKCDAVNTIQEFSEGGVCTTMEGSALDHVDEIHQLCEQEVYEMEQDAKLPWF